MHHRSPRSSSCLRPSIVPSWLPQLPQLLAVTPPCSAMPPGGSGILSGHWCASLWLSRKPPLIHKQFPEVIQSIHMPRLQIIRLLDLLRCPLVLPQCMQSRAKIVAGVGTVRPQGDRLLGGLLRSLVQANPEKSAAEEIRDLKWIGQRMAASQ